MTNSPTSFDNDKIATLALQSIFPTRWHFASPADIYNHHEFGQDWLITIVDENRKVTGNQFIVQNKVVPKTKDAYVRVRGIKVETIELLVSLGQPILLHIYDGTENRKGKSYWLWLDEWYIENRAKFKPNQKEVVVPIPRKNILNKKSLQQLTARIVWEHQKREVVHKADLISRMSKDYLIKVDTGDNFITSTVLPKHDGAIPQLVSLSEEADAAIKYVTETGLPTNILGKFAIQGPPDIFPTNFTDEQVVAILFPVIPDETIPMRIEYLDDKENNIFVTEFVALRLIQPGTDIRAWQGEMSYPHPISYKVLENKENQTREFTIQTNAKSKSFADLDKFFDWHDRVEKTEAFRITLLERQETILHDAKGFFAQDHSLKKTVLHSMVKYLAIIENGFNLKLSMPERIDNELLNNARVLAKIALTAKDIMEVKDLIPEGYTPFIYQTIPQIQDIIAAIAQNEPLVVFIQRPNAIVEFQGNSISLGPMQFEFTTSHILNLPNLQERISGSDLPETTRLAVGFEVDGPTVDIIFLDGPRTSIK